jgi:hypothetical protein
MVHALESAVNVIGYLSEMDSASWITMLDVKP